MKETTKDGQFLSLRKISLHTQKKLNVNEKLGRNYMIKKYDKLFMTLTSDF